ncbi:Rne/Rng family ribonuclease [Tropicimonas sp. TH_r6]|uniref:Rne/Rng family ribonuclease n=2 Tax=Rhodobacterales TaxID=204455 RepID=UPI002955658F|nr:Rne/Rng family ribonuclease [Tropicimonas sp. TH_r6]MDV7144927.1 Rne/Rng family ribonuclease [Tropicimonas sp. TH_r6]
MAKKMLIDATHAEETRVVVVDGNKVDEFDFETVNKRQLAGNIYLAKVTRVEPSLQAAFVDYGGNRHGFLAFSEIHPDYYQIPVADREALLAEEKEMNRDEEEDDGEESKKSRSRSRRSRSRSRKRDRKDEGSETQETEVAAAPVVPAIEGMDVVDFGEEAVDPDALASPIDVIEDGKEPAAEITTDDAGAETSEEPSQTEEPVEAAPAEDAVSETESAEAEASEQVVEAEAAETEADAPSEEPVAVEETAEAPAEAEQPEAVTAVDAEEVADTETDTSEAAPEEGETSEEEAPVRPIAARLEDDPADVVSGEVVEGDEADEAAARDEADTSVEDSAEPEQEPSAEEPVVEATEADAETGSDEAVEQEAAADAPVEEAASPEVAEDAPSEGKAEEAATEEVAAEETAPEASGDDTPADASAKPADESESSEEETGSDDDDEDEDHPGHDIESVAEEDVQEEIRRPRKPRMRRYKIQEVIKVRQIMLVQVVKEERGNKGAALTTYLSLAGRYCVLMPNTARGGGISRKITNASDRKKLKEIASEIDVPEGAGLIVRTAGAKRTKAEIKRDYEYLKRLWEQIRELTLKSIAPAPIYEEGNLIKRSIRDLYNREIDEVIVAGDEGYRVAKDFMKMIMPSHAKNVKPYGEPMPLFARYQVESYLGGMFNPVVQLKSGGYIVIGVTEALVAIDVNSGRATKEGSIEDTAVKTNLEAAEEVARQLRLRDLAGLIVIDFIDMEERKNNNAVEKRFKDKLKTDRARIQVGRISGFGLMEMSRQRLRPGMLEATTQPCPSCHGTGLLRSDDSIGLQILRQLEEEGGRRRSKEVLVKAPVGICNFLMNQKREHIALIEATYGLSVRIEADPSLVPPDFSIEKFKTATRWVPEVSAPVISIDTSDMPDLEEEPVVEEAVTAEPEPEASDEEDGAPKKKRRRRRRRRNGGSEDGQGDEAQNGAESDESAETQAEAESDESEDANGEESQKSGRSRRRRSRRRSGKSAEETSETGETENEANPEATVKAEAAETLPEADTAEPVEVSTEAPSADGGNESPAAEEPPQEAVTEAQDPVAEESAPETAAAAEETPATADDVQPDAAPAEEAAAEETVSEETVAEEEPVEANEVEEAEAVMAEVEVAPEPDQPAKPKRRGWWSVGR